MTQSIEKEQPPTESGVPLPPELSASPLAQKLQEVAQQMLLAGGLLEVDENVFSTCQEPIESEGDRLIRARDTRVPLVEVTVFPVIGEYGALKKLFGVSDRLALSVSRADGIEIHDEHRGNRLELGVVSLVVPGTHSISLEGDYGTRVKTVLSETTYQYYDGSSGKDCWGQDREPAFSAGFSYEDKCLLMSANLFRMI